MVWKDFGFSLAPMAVAVAGNRVITARASPCDLKSRKGLAYLLPGFEPAKGLPAKTGEGVSEHAGSCAHSG
jgi:hypothetical protein